MFAYSSRHILSSLGPGGDRKDRKMAKLKGEARNLAMARMLEMYEGNRRLRGNIKGQEGSALQGRNQYLFVTLMRIQSTLQFLVFSSLSCMQDSLHSFKRSIFGPVLQSLSLFGSSTLILTCFIYRR